MKKYIFIILLLVALAVCIPETYLPLSIQNWAYERDLRSELSKPGGISREFYKKWLEIYSQTLKGAHGKNQTDYMFALTYAAGCAEYLGELNLAQSYYEKLVEMSDQMPHLKFYRESVAQIKYAKCKKGMLPKEEALDAYLKIADDPDLIIDDDIKPSDKKIKKFHILDTCKYIVMDLDISKLPALASKIFESINEMSDAEFAKLFPDGSVNTSMGLEFLAEKLFEYYGSQNMFAEMDILQEYLLKNKRCDGIITSLHYVRASKKTTEEKVRYIKKIATDTPVSVENIKSQIKAANFMKMCRYNANAIDLGKRAMDFVNANASSFTSDSLYSIREKIAECMKRD